MDELLTFILGAVCVLTVIAVVGHGIWITVAAVVRFLSGGDGTGNSPQTRPCPHCGARYGLDRGRCLACGAVPHVKPKPSLRDELLATARQIKRLQVNGAIPAEQYEHLAGVIANELRRLEPGPATTAASSAATNTDEPVVAAELVDETVPLSSPHGDSSAASAPAPPWKAASPAATTSEDIVVVRSNVPTAKPDLAPAFRKTYPPQGVDAQAPPRASEAFAAGADGLAAISPPVAVGPPPPPPPKLSDMLQSFLEESNIRWGEILAGFFIVVSSIGLVISLQATLERIPYFPALLFTGFTVAFHGAGLYTLKRWNLHAVSRVVLVISLLLVPLTASAAVLMSRRGLEEAAAAPPVLFWIVLAIGTVALSWVAYTSSRELVGSAKWRLTIAVVGCALAEVLIHRLQLASFGFWELTAVALFPLGCFLIATAGQIIHGRRWRHISWPRAQQTLIVTGVALFALLAALAMLLMKAEPRWLAAARLSPTLSLAAGATMAIGLLLHGRTTARKLSGVRTTGTFILILGGAAMVLMVVLAWPQPELLLGVGLVNAILLLLLAVAADLSLLLAPAVACLVLSTVIGLHWLQGRFDAVPAPQLGARIVEAVLMGRSSLALLGLAIAVCGGGAVAWRKKRSSDAETLFASAGVVSLLGILISLFSGFIDIPQWSQDASLAAPLLFLYAAALLAAGAFAPWPYVASAGSVALFLGLIQALAFNPVARDLLHRLRLLPDRTLMAALIVHALVSTAVLAGVLRRRLFDTASEFAAGQGTALRKNFVEPLALGACATLLLAIPLMFVGRPSQLDEAALAAVMAGAGWLLLGLATRWKPTVAGLQAMLLLAATFAIGHYWFSTTGDDWYRLLPHATMQLAAIGFGSGVWALLRRSAAPTTVAGDLMRAEWPAVDQMAIGIATLVAAGLAWLTVLPGIAWELGFDKPREYFVTSADASAWSAATWTIIAVVGVLLGLAASLWERVRLLSLAGVAMATFTLVAAAAMPWEGEVATASAIRWSAALFAVVWGALFIARRPIQLSARSIRSLHWERIDRPVAHAVFGAVPLLGALPILILTILAVMQNAGGVELRGPVADTFFDKIGPTASYAGPLLAIVAVLLGYSLREREPTYAFGGAGVFQLAINLAFLLYATFAPAATPTVRAVEWLQWNSVAAGGYALVWLALLRWMLPAGLKPVESPTGQRAGQMLAFQLGVAGLGVAALVGWAGWSVAWEPQLPSLERMKLGGILSYIGLALVCSGAGWLVRQYRSERILRTGDLVFVLAGGLVALVAATVDRFDTARDWLAYHTLTGGWLGLIGLGTAAICLPSRGVSLVATSNRRALSAPFHGLIAAVAFLLTLLAVRGNLADPSQPWWSFAAAVGVLLAMTAIGLRRGSQPYAYSSVVAAALTVALLWLSPAMSAWRIALGPDRVAVAVETLTVTLLLAAAFWQGAEIFWQTRASRSLDVRFFGPRVHDIVLFGLLPLYLLWRLSTALFANQPGEVLRYDDHAAVVAVVCWGLVLASSLWDRRAVLTLPAQFLWLAVVSLLVLGLVGPQVPGVYSRLTVMTFAAGLLPAIAGQAWSYGANLSVLGLRLGISDPVSGLKRTESWLPPVSVILAAATSLLGLVFVLTVEKNEVRTLVAFAPAAAGWGLACLADDARRPYLRLLSLLAAGLSAIYLAWAQLGVGMSEALWLTRSFRLLMVLSVLTFIYGLALPRWLLTSGPWNAATRKAGYLAGVAAIAAFVGVLVLEIALFEPGVGAPVDAPQVLAIAVVLVVLIAGLISMALLQGRDPLGLSEKGRQGYVYGALATAALLFAHLYVCRPMWFDAGLLPYWPLIVMAIAFLGAGGGELFARYRLNVLAEPFLRVSSMLPLLPVLGMWIVAPKESDYALVLLVVGLLYLMLSVTRRSWASLLAAVVAGNGALWSLLNRSGFEILANPQLWLIPPALSVLLAAQVNRKRLPAAALTSIRYGCVLLIYVSSTSEIFLRGVATSLWPAMILATLSVAGAMLGMALRIRAFLYLGASFALVSLITMVAHAAQAIDHVWPWWAFGVGMGIAILVLFGIFEKQREEVLRLVAKLKEWEQ